MTKANDPVFSTQTISPNDGVFNHPPIGLTKREYFAGLAMQTLLKDRSHKKQIDDVCEKSVRVADELLKQLENETTK